MSEGRMAIRSFADSDTQACYEGNRTRRIPADVERRARRKLRLLDATVELRDLRSPPGNRLEALAGDRAGQHSIRINDQWRICFVWADGHAFNVEVVDYHR